MNIVLNYLPITRRKKLVSHIRSLPKLLAYYPLDESSGNAINRSPLTFGAYNGTVTGSPYGAVGKVGRAFNFNNDSTKSVAFTNLIPVLPFSFFMLIKQVSIPANNSRIMDWQAGGPADGFTVIQQTSDNTTRLQVNNGGAQTCNISFTALVNGNWTLIGANVTSNPTKTYVSGVYTGNQDTSVVMTTPAATSITLGRRATAATNPANALIQHLGFVSRAMDVSEFLKIAQLANAA